MTATPASQPRPLAYPRVLLIDNFDSFTYNLVDYLRRLGCRVQVVRNTTPPEALEAFEFDLMLLSPGPSVPRQAGHLMAIVSRFAERKPIFGVCLGLQALVEHFGGRIGRVAPRHGKSDPTTHDGRTLFAGLPPVLHVGRYHSWAATELPAVLEVSARAQDGTVMAIRHKLLPIEAVQFHPESILSMEGEVGMRLLGAVVSGALVNGYGDYRRLMQQLQGPAALTAPQLDELVRLLAAQVLTEDQRLVLLVALAFRLQQAPALAQFVQVLLSHSTLRAQAATRADTARAAVDVCGTGGSGLPRLNTSTLAAMLLAHMGLPVAKHGNRAASGRTGSFDLLEALGIDLSTPPAHALEALERTRLAFLFAPAVHPVMGQLAGARARVGIPTLFNILGPLLNPLQPARQFIGTAFEEYQPLLLEAGIALGRTQLYVARADDGLDEISVSAPTRILSWAQGRRGDERLSPQDFGLEPVPFEAVSVPNRGQSVAIAQRIMAGQLDSAHHQLVAANAAFLYRAFVAPELSLPEAYARALEALGSGALARQLDEYRSALATAQPLSAPAA